MASGALDGQTKELAPGQEMIALSIRWSSLKPLHNRASGKHHNFVASHYLISRICNARRLRQTDAAVPQEESNGEGTNRTWAGQVSSEPCRTGSLQTEAAPYPAPNNHVTLRLAAAVPLRHCGHH
jgi:hypothetical protein